MLGVQSKFTVQGIPWFGPARHMGEHSAVAVHEFPALGPPTHAIVDAQLPLGFAPIIVVDAVVVVIGIHLVPTVMRIS
jgi:hypothetical protein